MRGLLLILLLVSGVAACTGPAEPEWASDEMVAQATYRHSGPTRLTLFTMVSNDTGSGMHSSLMINASQRVVFDPAGSFRHEQIPVRNDVVYGMTPRMADFYTRYHARQTFHVVVQEVDVSPEVAELTLQKVQAYGAVPKAQCALSTSRILSSVPGFTHIKPGYYPNRLSEQFAQVAGVRTEKLYEYDDDDKSRVLAAYDPALVLTTSD